jgi:hypothetical protein
MGRTYSGGGSLDGAGDKGGGEGRGCIFLSEESTLLIRERLIRV